MLVFHSLTVSNAWRSARAIAPVASYGQTGAVAGVPVLEFVLHAVGLIA